MNLELENSYFVGCLSYLYGVYPEHFVLLNEKEKEITILLHVSFLCLSIYYYCRAGIYCRVILRLKTAPADLLCCMLKPVPVILLRTITTTYPLPSNT